MVEKSKKHLQEAMTKSKEHLSNTKDFLKNLENASVYDVADEAFQEFNEHLRKLDSKTRQNIIEVYNSSLFIRLKEAGFHENDIKDLIAILNKKWLEILETADTKFSSKDLYFSASKEWESYLEKVDLNVLKDSKIKRKEFVLKIQSLGISFGLPAAIGGALIGGAVSVQIGAFIGFALGALVSSFAKEGNDD